MKVLVTENGVHPCGVELLKKHFDVDCRDSTSVEELERIIGEYDAIVIQAFTKVPRSVLEKAEKLKLIARAGTGLEHVDLEYAKKRGIVVKNTPQANAVSVAELTFGLMIAVARKIVSADAYVRSRKGWDRPSYKGIELFGKTLGLIGFGNIGRLVAVRANAFGMKVVAYDPFVPAGEMKQTGVTRIGELDELLSASDVVSVHVPLTDETRHMIGAEQFGKMKPTAIFINTCRGAVVDEAALAAALKEGKIAGAGIDAYEEEPPLNSPLLELENVVLTPHTGGITKEAVERMSMQAAEIVIDFFTASKS